MKAWEHSRGGVCFAALPLAALIPPGSFLGFDEFATTIDIMVTQPRWDVFISHASEDKDTFVRPLAEALISFGVKVWYDEFALEIGDSLSRSIDKGLIHSNFGLVVLSPSFIRKNWPEYELRGLIAKEINGQKVIVPIWHDLTHDELLKYSPPLADKYAIQSNSHSLVQLAAKVIGVIRPDLFEKIARRAAFLDKKNYKPTETINTKEIKFGPPAHDILPFNLVCRVRLIRAALLSVYVRSMDHWIEGFRGDAHPSREIRIWEHVAACYLEYVSVTELTADQRKAVFDVFLSMSLGVSEDVLLRTAEKLTGDTLETLRELWRSQKPIFDLEDDSFPSTYFTTEERQEWLRKIDVETFPHDVPDELVYELLGQRASDDEEDI